MSRLNFESLQQDLRAHIVFAKSFSRHPLHSIQNEASWDYQRSLVFLVTTSVISGGLGGFVLGSAGNAIISMIFLPIISVVVAFGGAYTLHHLMRFVHHRELDTEQLFQVVAISFFPFLVFRILHNFAPPITLVGLAATCAVLIVGLTDRFNLPRNSIIKIISIFFAFYFVYWGISLVRNSHFRKNPSQNISDESIRVLDQEFKTEGN